MSVLSLSSCISDDEVVTSSECGIISFSVGDIKSALTVKNASGEDTVVYRTIGGSEIKFNIDQVNGRIYGVDSLPVWTDLSAVVPKFSSYGYVYGQTKLSASNDTAYYYVTSGSDSVDLRKPLSIYVVATDGVSKKHYTVEMFKKTVNTDTLEWKKVNLNATFGANCKFVVADGKVYAFHNDGGETSVSESVTGTDWTTKNAGAIKGESVIIFGNKFYALGNDSYIYASEDGASWAQASSGVVERLLGADKFRIYAFDGSKIIGSSDLQTWNVYGDENIDRLPTSNVSIQSFTSNTNRDIEYVTMVGLSASDLKYSVSWFKVSAQDSFVDQKWSYTEILKKNMYKFPYLEELSATAYDGAIFAIGKNGGAYDYIYRSDDNGISWHPLTSKYLLPEGINDDNTTTASILTVGNELWIVKGNNVWKGVIE